MKEIYEKPEILSESISLHSLRADACCQKVNFGGSTMGIMSICNCICQRIHPSG